MKKLLLTFLLGLASLTVTAQQSLEWEELLDELYATGEEHTVTREENLETLTDLAAHPVNLNTATREDLERIPFLTAGQIEELQAYVYQYHGMQSLGELAMIESLDAVRRQQFDESGHWTDSATPQAWASPEDTIRQQEFMHTMEYCLEHLPDNTARVFMLREWMGLEVAEICQQTGISADNCYTILYRARNGLRRCLQSNWLNG